MEDLRALAWPIARLGEAIQAVARASGLTLSAREPPRPHTELSGDGEDTLGPWIEATAAWLGLEAEPVETPYAEVAWLVRRAGPALMRLPGQDGPCFLALHSAGRRGVVVLGPDLGLHHVRLEVLCASLCHAYEAPLVAEVERLLDEVGVPPRHRARARGVLLRERLGATRIDGCWLLRPTPGTPLWQQLRHARIPRRLLGLVGAHAAQYLVWLLSWWVVGQGALQGQLDPGWLAAWALLLLTLVPLRMLVTWSQGLVAIAAGGLLKVRLLAGALQLEPEELRHQGVGQLLGRVIEAAAVESLALSGGILGLVAVLELIIAAALLGAVAGAWVQALLLLGWMVFSGFVGWRYFQRRNHWTAMRLDLTHDLVERMVGHRTRLAQEAPESWHDGEDQGLDGYLGRSTGMDRAAATLLAVVPRGWMVLGLIGFAPVFVTGHSSPATLAVSLGGMLLAYEAFRKLAIGLGHVAGAAIAWEQVAPLFHAAARAELGTSPSLVFAPRSRASVAVDAQPVLQAHDLVFRFRAHGDAVLRGCSLHLDAGERLLLEGPSGSGKSTLASLLTGLRRPESGLLLLDGLDRQTLGAAGWRRRVVAAPQFHDNHVFSGTFAFNLLLGRRWPPHPDDVEAAEALCHELGLGDLLGRMPAGLLQMVGETGWQLSHGERSRLYMARALLQGADVIVLDESFAALDPETLQRALRCVLQRAPTLLVIAHP